MSNTTMEEIITINDGNQDYWIGYILFLNKTISQYVLGFIWLMGNIGSFLTCLVFHQPRFRNSPCTIYFMASSLSQIFTFNFALFTRMLQFGYNIQTINTVVWFCKIRYYLFYIAVAVPRYNIILASIDRYLASSRDALRRQWSSQKIARRLIFGNIIFWSIIYIQVLIFYEIQNGQCLPRRGTYGMFFSIYITIDSGILPVLLMAIFGILTVRNVRRTKHRIRPNTMINDIQIPTQHNRLSRKDTHFSRMLANEICMFIILDMANPCYLLYQAFTINDIRSLLQNTIESFIGNMTYVLIYLGFSLIFLTFIISSKMFRKEFQRLIRTKIFHQPSARETTLVQTQRTNR